MRRSIWFLILIALFATACGSSGDNEAARATAAASTPNGSGDTSTESTTEPNTDSGSDGDATAAFTKQGVPAVPVADNYDPNGVFKWGYTVEATSMDPQRGSSGFDQNWLLPAYDRLVYIDPDGNPQPMLATEWGLVDNGAALEFKIREGVVFHDGAPLDAAAVKASLDRAMNDPDSTVKPVFASVSSIKVVDDYTVQLVLDGPPGALIANLGDRAGMIISPTALENDDLDRFPVGAGPYRVTDYVLGDRVIYKRFEDYWDPEIQRTASLEFIILSADATRFNAIRSGDLDVALAREAQIEPGLADGLGLLAGPTPNFYSMAVNASIAPFDNPLVRRALDYAINREAIAEGIFGGFCQPTRQPFPETSWAFNSEVGHGLEVYDPAEAKRLLAEAGYPDGFEFTALGSPITGYKTLAEVLQAQFADIGVTMNLEITDQLSSLFSVDKTYPAIVVAYAPTADPSGVLDNVYLPSGLSNPGELDNPVLDGLAQQGLESVDTAERAPIYQEMAAEIMSMDSAYYPICMRTRQEFFVPGTSGISIYVSGARDWRGVAVSGD